MLDLYLVWDCLGDGGQKEGKITGVEEVSGEEGGAGGAGGAGEAGGAGGQSLGG